MDFDALFNEKTFQFSDFQEFTVCSQNAEATAKRIIVS